MEDASLGFLWQHPCAVSQQYCRERTVQLLFLWATGKLGMECSTNIVKYDQRGVFIIGSTKWNQQQVRLVVSHQ
jgi:hypothetical protein